MTDYTIEWLNLSKQNLTVLPDLSLYTKLKTLYCEKNKLTSLDNLPPNLQTLVCSFNQLTSLDNLPPNLQYLHCENNELTSIEHLPITLQRLICRNNPIDTTCKEVYGFTLSKKKIEQKTIEQYNEIKRLEKECCPLLK